MYLYNALFWLFLPYPLLSSFPSCYTRFFPYSCLVLFHDPLSLARTIHVTMGFELLEPGRLTTPVGTQLRTMAPHQLDSANREEQGCMAPIPHLWLTVNRTSLLQASSSCCRFGIAMVEAYSKDDAPDGVFLPVSQPLCSFCFPSHEEEWCFRTRKQAPNQSPGTKFDFF